jgi:hypothetical protein
MPVFLNLPKLLPAKLISGNIVNAEACLPGLSSLSEAQNKTQSE